MIKKNWNKFPLRALIRVSLPEYPTLHEKGGKIRGWQSKIKTDQEMTRKTSGRERQRRGVSQVTGDRKAACQFSFLPFPGSQRPDFAQASNYSHFHLHPTPHMWFKRALAIPARGQSWWMQVSCSKFSLPMTRFRRGLVTHSWSRRYQKKSAMKFLQHLSLLLRKRGMRWPLFCFRLWSHLEVTLRATAAILQPQGKLALESSLHWQGLE